MEFSRQEYWSRLPFSSPGDLPNLGIKPRSPALQADPLPSESTGKPYNHFMYTYICVCVYALSCVQLLVTPWTAACLVPLSMVLSRQEYSSGFPFPIPGDLPNPGIEPLSLASPALADRFFTTVTPGKSIYTYIRSVAQSCPTLCDPMSCSTPGLPVHHQLPEFTETHVHHVSDAIQPSHPLSSPSPLAPNPSQHHSLFQ